MADDLVRTLGIRYPIIQAPMGGGASPPEMAIAVSEAGGLGSLAAGYLSAGQIADAGARIRRGTARPFAINLLAKTTPGQLYSYGRRLQSEKKDAEAMEILKDVAKRYPESVQGHLANARIKSAAGDFAGAAEDAKKAQAAATSDQQKNNIKTLIDRLQAKQDINK